MVPTVTRLSAPAAIVKIRRVDALIIPLLFVPLLLLPLVFTRLPRYFFYSLMMSAPINSIPRSRSPRPDRRRRRAFAFLEHAAGPRAVRVAY